MARGLLRKKNGGGGIKLLDFRFFFLRLQIILQSYSNQNNMVATCKRMKPGHFLIPYTKINSNGLKT